MDDIKISQYLTVKDVQDILQMGKDKVYQLCSLEGFPAIKIGKQYKINPEKFKKWLDRHEGMTVELKK